MSKPVVFVIGASGNVGAATVKALAAKYVSRVEIRAGVRNPDKAEALKSLSGVSVVRAEMGTAELETTLKGVDSLFIVTPGVENRAELASATAVSAKKAGVKHLVVISGDHSEKAQARLFTQHFAEIEANVKAMGVPYTFFCLCLFMENYFGFKESIKDAGTIASSVDPTKPFDVVAVADIGKAAAVVLVDPSNHVNKTYNIISDRHSYGELTAAFEEALGKKVTYTRITYDDAKKGFLSMGFDERAAMILLEMNKLIDEGDPIACREDVGDYEKITGEKPTSLKSWVAQVKEEFQ